MTGVKDTWAPEWFKDTDGSVHLIVSIDTVDSQFKSYLYTASDDTLSNWSAPTPLGIGPNYIDTFVVKLDAKYHAFTKNETSKYIEHATAAALTGPWTFVGTGDWAGWGSGKEGPALFRLDSGQWRILMDCYGNCGFLQATSPDLNTWSSASVMPGGLSGVVRHGTVLREEDAVLGDGGASASGGASHAGASGAGSSGAGALNAGNAAAGSDAASSAGTSGAVGVAGAATDAGSGGTLGVVSGVGGNTASSGLSGHAVAGAESVPAGASEGCSCSAPNAKRPARAALALVLILGAVLRARRSLSPSR